MEQRDADERSRSGPVSAPRSALVLSAFCLVAPLLAFAMVPEWVEGQGALLVWVPALIPGFLLAYHRGWTGASVALAGGMAALALSQVEVLLLELEGPPWGAVFGVVVLLVVVAVGSGWLADLLGRERAAAERMALTDPLTRLANRRHALLFLEANWPAGRRRTALAVVVFDIDHFKRVNDTHGHAAGDEVLRAFGRVLQERTRASDLSARLGGEEFVSILIDCSSADAARFAEDVRGSLAAVQHGWGSVTSSAGVAEYDRSMDKPEALVAAADRALYAAKRAGRDRVRRADLLDLEASGAKEAAAPPPAQGPASATVPENLRVLLVDDDPATLRATRRALERLGCRVDAFTNPFEAVKHMQERKVAPHVLVTDVVMPEMSGFALVDMIGRLVKGLPVLYVSGYDQREMYWSGVPGGRSAILDKPFSSEQLRQALAGLIQLEAVHGPVGPALSLATSEPASEAPARARGRSSTLADDVLSGRMLIVDDDIGLLRSLRRLFEEHGYRSVRCLPDPVEAVAVARSWKPDLVLCDIHMPGMDGFEVMASIASSIADSDWIPVIALTGDEDRGVRRKALELGATDFIRKPMDTAEALARVRNALQARTLHSRALADRDSLEQRVSERTWELAATRTEILHRLARAAEYRDDVTGRHAARVGLLSALIGAELEMSADDRELIRRTAPIHDIGKIGIPDRILHKSGPLTEAEFDLMKRHTSIGARILEGGRHRILRMARDIAEAHHERWDGAGYPHRLAGGAIPMEARIVAVADTFDVLVHTRPYKSARSPSEAVAEIVRCRGSHFDPDVADAMASISARVGPDSLPRLVDPVAPLEDMGAPGTVVEAPGV